MPSVLVETGFLTNKREGAYLNSKKGQNEISGAIAKAIVNYQNVLEKGVVNQQVFEEKEIQKKQSKITSNQRNVIRFRVQLAASKNPIDAKPYNFKGLKNVIRDKEGAFYKYYFGSSKNYKQIQKEQKKARRAGFKSAFIVSFRGNQKIKLSEALDALK
jgi:N-acetylmuramoyl-L-alanine amidase